MKQSLLFLTVAGCFLNASAQTSSREDVPHEWHLRDRQRDGFYGVSIDKAYEFVKNKKSKTVIVAVIDSGIDTLHEDLKPVLWTNAKEIAGNGTDDDKNGYVDDVHGWNFLGGKDGRNVTKDSYEAARVYHKFKQRFQSISDTSTFSTEADKHLYAEWKRSEQQITGGDSNNGFELLMLKRTYAAAVASDSIVRKGLAKEKYTGKELEAYSAVTDEQKKGKRMLLVFFTQQEGAMDMTNEALLADFKGYLESEEQKAEASDKAPVNYRGTIVKDNYEDFNDRFYGNNNIMVDLNGSKHGTHVAGIIGAARKNGKGVDGIANDVKIMAIRAVPDGDEHDKDIALAIRYAVDNGAKIINMSFGKSFSPEKHWIDEAVKYADSKGVLLVHAAGNDGNNLDSTATFPNPNSWLDGKTASNWITVGASGDPKAGGLVAYFSNYGKKEVDVFAPGVKIYSTVPGGNKYGNLQGTSMASPVVAGVAAFLASYYPNLTPQQLKQVIEASAIKPAEKVRRPGEGPVELSELSKTGGIINAYEAAVMAEKISSGKPFGSAGSGQKTAAPKAKKVATKKSF